MPWSGPIQVSSSRRCPLPVGRDIRAGGIEVVLRPSLGRVLRSSLRRGNGAPELALQTHGLHPHRQRSRPLSLTAQRRAPCLGAGCGHAGLWTADRPQPLDKRADAFAHMPTAPTATSLRSSEPERTGNTNPPGGAALKATQLPTLRCTDTPPATAAPCRVPLPCPALMALRRGPRVGRKLRVPAAHRSQVGRNDKRSAYANRHREPRISMRCRRASQIRGEVRISFACAAAPSTRTGTS
jgi:hypothetical protein